MEYESVLLSVFMAPDNTENDGIPSIGSWYTVVSTTIYHEKTRNILLSDFEKNDFIHIIYIGMEFLKFIPKFGGIENSRSNNNTKQL